MGAAERTKAKLLAAEVKVHTVLIVDDNELVCSALRELLTHHGYDLVDAPNGAVALEMLEKGLRPLAIVLDLVMPVMDGWQFLRAWHEGSLASIPVIVVSGTYIEYEGPALSARYGCEVLPLESGLKRLVAALHEIAARHRQT